MYVILDRTGKIIGTSDLPVNLDDLSKRGEIAVFSDLNLPLLQLEVVGFPATPEIRAKSAPSALPKLLLISSAEDTDGDGFPELPADGTSQASLVVLLHDDKSQAILDPVEVHLRTSAGALSHRKVVAKGGRVQVKLTASQETVMANIRASAAGFEPAELTFEFVPPDELQPSASSQL